MIPLGAVEYLENIAACHSKSLRRCEWKCCVARISQEIIHIADHFNFSLTNNLLPRYNCFCGYSISLNLGWYSNFKDAFQMSAKGTHWNTKTNISAWKSGEIGNKS